jgi:hypothetical protein
MKVIYWPQGYGKTTALVDEARKVGGVVVAKSEASRKYIEGKRGDVEVYTVSDLINGALADSDKPIFIDDADALLNSFISSHSLGAIGGISINMSRPY